MIKRLGMVAGFLIFFAAMLVPLYFVWQANANTAEDGPVEVCFLQTRNDANCTLLKQGGACIVIDTGEDVDAPAVVAFLKGEQVQSIDYLVLTHPDPAHVGGALAILEQFDVQYVIQPYANKDHEATKALTDAINAKGITIIYPTRSRRFVSGGMQMTIYAPLEKYYNNDNNYSLAVQVNHDNVNMVFAGDAEEKRLSEMMLIHWPAVQLYQVAHHGRSNRSSAAFIEMIRPQYMIVSSMTADQAIRDAGAQVGAEVFYTAHGTVYFASDGKTLSPVMLSSDW